MIVAAWPVALDQSRAVPMFPILQWGLSFS